MTPEDRIKKDVKGKDELKPEVAKEEDKLEEGMDVGGDEQAVGENGDDDDDDDEVPYQEDIGWREIFGFIVMYIQFPETICYWLICL
jgi:hypothetical protein